MAFRNPSLTLSRRTRLLLPVLAILILLVILLVVFTGIYTNYLFYREVHFNGVFSTVYKTRILLFLLAGLFVSVIACGNAVVAYRIRPPFRPASIEQQNLDRYRLAIEPRLRVLLVVFGGVLTVFAGLAGQARWQTWLLWRHGQTFPGQTDPQFHKNISFYLFTYPMERLALDVTFVALAIGIVVSLFVHYLYGGIRLQTPGEKAVPAAKAHLSVLLGIFVLFKAVAYYLDRYGLNYSTRGFVDTGASYTDVHVVLPAKTILLVIAIVCALLFFTNIRLRGWLLPGVAMGLLVLSAVVIGALVPAIVQNFSVRPNEVAKESPYIQRNITATRFAYGLSDVKETDYNPATASAATAAGDTNNVGNVRLLDPSVLSSTYDQLQQLKNYYQFPQDLDIDRYTVNGKLQDYVVAARELNLAGLTAAQNNWINTHLAYTHGNGLVAAPANQVDAGGAPVFSKGEANIPATGVLGLSKNPDGSRIYYGEDAPAYSVVNTKQAEIDGPGVGGADQATNTYDGSGGVKLSGIDRLLYAIRFQDANLVLSSSITTNSRIMYYRNPRDRVQKVAPWLTLDGDPYPTVIKGRVTWVLDGYTTSDLFPYSARRTLGAVTADATNTQSNSNNAQQANDEVNYIRNSVKATVDADTGAVNLYAFDPTDPVLKTWMSIFPNTVQPASAMPQDLLDHIRYPEDLFKVQRDLLSQYHVTDPQAFYSKQDAWDVPTDPSSNTGQPQPPFYVVSQVPGQSSPQFNLTTSYVPQGGRRNLAAFLSVSSGPGTPGDAASAYGAFTLLRAPSNPATDGVPQVQNNFNSFQAFSQARTLLDSGGSHVINGNLLSIPTGGGILYVEPIYVTGSSSTNGSLPLLRDVLTSYNGTIGYAPTLAGALAQSFGAAPQATPSSTPAPGASASPSTSGTPAPATSSAPVSTAVPSALPTSVSGVASALQTALAAQEREAAAGDYTAAAASQARVNALIAQLGTLVGGTPSPSASAAPKSPTPSATPSG